MKALLITVGSRGDAEPYCSLAASLAERQHQVDLFLQPEHHCLAPTSPNVKVHELPFTQKDFYRYISKPSHGADHSNPRVKFIGIVTDCIGELVLPCWERVLNVAKHTDAIVTSSLARPLYIGLSTKLSKPLYIIHLQPLAPTGDFPHYISTDACVEAILGLKENKGTSNRRKEYEDGYWDLEKYGHDFLQKRLDQVYSNLDLPSFSFEDDLRPMLSGQDENTLIINAFSTPEVIPCCSDSGVNIFDIGPLADAYIPGDFDPSQELLAFLEKSDEPPLCVGYGSMPFGKVDVIVDTLKEFRTRAIFVGQAKKSTEDEWISQNTLHIASVPYAWLLPKCSMLLCHGGAGTVHVALRAGVPLVILL
ncbi:hypothetical protein ACHAWF_017990 [Thalassiosira exigua]